MEPYLARLEEYVTLLPEADAIYRSILQNPVALAFSVAIAVIFVFGTMALLITRLAGMRRGTKFVSIVPNTLATLGVLGTFTGILLGLLDFRVDDIDASIPKLLGGLTVAFSTSIAGMSSAMLFRILDALLPSRRRRGAATIDDLRDLLRDIHEHNRKERSAIGSVIEAIKLEMEKQTDTNATALLDLRKSISSESDTSLVTQMQKLRNTLQDGQNDLLKEFRQFSTHMTENTNKAIVEALERVIRDFNERITAQFGDNFKQLNEAVGKLLEWQEKYRTYLETTEQRIEIASTALESSGKTMEAVSEHSAAIPAAIALLTPPLIALNEQSRTLATHLEAVGGLRDRALEAFPVIESNIVKLTGDLGGHVDKAILTTNETLERQQVATETLTTSFSKLSEQSDRAHEAFTAEFSKTLAKMSEESATAFAGHSALIERSLKEVEQNVTEAWKKTEQSIDRRMEQLDEEMQKELERCLASMGSKLASLSGKFVEDYEPLTDRLREIVQIAARTR